MNQVQTSLVRQNWHLINKNLKNTTLEKYSQLTKVTILESRLPLTIIIFGPNRTVPSGQRSVQSVVSEQIFEFDSVTL